MTQRFVILAQPRSGSNMLCSLLDSHPRVLCHHELFNPRGIFTALDQRGTGLATTPLHERDHDPVGFLERVWADAPGVLAVGLKMTRRQHHAAFEHLLQDPLVTKVVLRRRGRLRRFVSLCIAEQLDRWEVYQGEPPLTGRRPVHVSPDALWACIDQEAAYHHAIDATLSDTGQTAVRVVYEDLLEPAGHRALLCAMGLPNAPLRARSVRQNPEPLRALIANHAALARALRDTDLEQELAS